MNDLISRQLAIDALVKAIREDPYYDSNERINGLGVYDVRVIINDLPSAQPEQRWIPCSKRLPENRRYVLVTYQHEYGLIDHGITWYGEAEKKWDTSRNVVAWMPLPEPYLGGDSE